MKNVDKYFQLLLVTFVSLAIIALMILFGSDMSGYKVDTSAEGVAQNYLLALQKEDYSRAYHYLSQKIEGLPASVEEFSAPFKDNQYYLPRFKERIFSIDSIQRGVDQTVISFSDLTNTGSNVFPGDQFLDSFTMTLIFEDEMWKIIDCSSYYCLVTLWPKLRPIEN